MGFLIICGIFRKKRISLRHGYARHQSGAVDRKYFHIYLHAEAFYAEARAPNLQFGAAITGFATLRRKS